MSHKQRRQDLWDALHKEWPGTGDCGVPCAFWCRSGVSGGPRMEVEIGSAYATISVSDDSSGITEYVQYEVVIERFKIMLRIWSAWKKN